MAGIAGAPVERVPDIDASKALLEVVLACGVRAGRLDGAIAEAAGHDRGRLWP